MKSNKNPVLAPRVFVPFWNPPLYFHHLAIEGNKNLAAIRQLHEENPIPVEAPVVKKQKIVVLKTVDHVPVRLTVGEDGHVSVTVCAAVNTMQNTYYAKGKKPPLEQRIEACRQVGYSESIISAMRNKDEKWKNDSDDIDQFIFDIFGASNDKKAATTKKKNMYQLLKIKKLVCVLPDESDKDSDTELDI